MKPSKNTTRPEEPTRAELARWKSYQVDSHKYGVKLVAELTDAEAKNELCKAMAAVEKLDDLVSRASDRIDAWRTDRRPEPRRRSPRKRHA